jgi:hypothetical protein
MNPKLQADVNSQGWRQFLMGRKDMLDAFDRGRNYGKLHEVETYHGIVAEAQFRKWLSEFLPKKYAVTSGYIISQGLKENDKTPHFDVIIYDSLEAPVLWIEDHSDTSDHGKSRAIPAEFVKAVLEVKSSFQTKTVRDAINHLEDLKPLMAGEDSEEQPYKVYLPKNFVCGIIFFELRTEHSRGIAPLDAMMQGIIKGLKGFAGGLILRGNDRTDDASGMLTLMQGNFEVKQPTPQNLIFGNGITSSSITVETDTYFNFLLMWMPGAFSNFMFSLLTLMNGTFRQGFIPSFYGFGANLTPP